MVLVEAPAGCALRHQPPFLEDVPGKRSVWFECFGTGKRSVVLDLDVDADRRILTDMIANCDLVIEDWPTETVRRRGLTYDALARINPRLVVATLTPFGRTGPYAEFQASDLTLLAMGGFLTMIGYPDRPPNQPPANQAIAIGGMFLAVGSMIALFAAARDGHGQHVDVSVQECVTMAMENAAQFWDLNRVVRRRFAGLQRHAGTGLFPCADGYVYLFAGGMGAMRFWGNLAAWLIEERVTGADVLAEERWRDVPYLDRDEAKVEFNAIFAPFARTRTKADLYNDGQSRQVPICPVNSPADVVTNRQFRYRDFLVEVEMHEARRALMPGVPFRMSATPGRVRPAPALGAHTREVLGVQHAAVETAR